MPRPKTTRGRRPSQWKAQSTAWSLPEPLQELLDSGDPAFSEVTTALARARLQGEDIEDPAVLTWVIALGRANHAEARDQWAASELVRTDPDTAA